METEIKNLAMLYWVEFIISKIGPHVIPSLRVFGSPNNLGHCKPVSLMD